MSTIPDHQIARLCEEQRLVQPFDHQQVNPASYDVRLGSDILIEGLTVGPESMRERWQKVNIDQGYWLKPNEFILAVTQEYLNVPKGLEAVFQLKSSRGREGFNHCLAGYIDPGFSGRVTLELQNLNQRHSLFMKTGMLIGQLRFSSLASAPAKDYSQTGHYQNDNTVMASKTLVFDGLPEN
jgi:dCTP deaminase